MHGRIFVSDGLLLSFTANVAVRNEIRRIFLDQNGLNLCDCRDECLVSAPVAAW